VEDSQDYLEGKELAVRKVDMVAAVVDSLAADIAKVPVVVVDNCSHSYRMDSEVVHTVLELVLPWDRPHVELHSCSVLDDDVLYRMDWHYSNLVDVTELPWHDQC
jgi:hypothetical protein